MATELAKPANGRRLRKSTFFVAALAFALAVLFNLPGEAGDGGRLHGWPLTYLNRSIPTPMTPPGYVCVLYPHQTPDIWSLTSHVERLDPWRLCGNVLTAAANSCAAAGTWELCRRRFGALLRFTIRTAAIVMVAVSFVFGR